MTRATIANAKNIKKPYAAFLLLTFVFESSAFAKTIIGIKKPPNPPMAPARPPFF